MSKDIKEQLNDIENKLDEHTKILSSVDKTLALQAQQLEQHMMRTQLAEENLEILRKELKPVQKHVEFINGLSKLITLAGTVIGIIYAVYEIITKVM